MPTDTMTVGQRFKKFRTERGMSQPDVCEGICSYTMVSLLENDKKIPSPRIMKKLAEKLGVPLREIMWKDEQGLEIDFQIEMLRVYIEMADYAHALELIDKLSQREDMLQHQEVEVLLCRVKTLNKTGRYEETSELLLPFLKEQAQQSIDDETLCDTYNMLGNAYFELRDFEKAFSAYEQGYRLSLKLPDFGLISARVTFNLGIVCNQLSLKAEARSYLEKAKSFFETVSDVHSMAKTLFALAIATVNPEQMNQARILYESLNLVSEANLVKQHYAFHIQSKTDYNKAVNELQEIATVYTGLGDLGMSLYTLTRAVKICLDNSDLDQATSYMLSAVEMEKMLQDKTPFVVSYFYKVKSEFNYHQGDFESSISNSLKASDMYEKMGIYSESANALEICARVHEHCGDLIKSNEVLRKVVSLLKTGTRR